MKSYRGSSVTAVVRESKFRHIFGKIPPKSSFYEDIRVETARSLESNLIAASSKFLAVPSQGGGGPVVVLPLQKTGISAASLPKRPHSEFTGRVPHDIPTVQAHESNITDLAFSPFDPSLLATAGEDSFVRLWRIEEGGLRNGEGKKMEDCSAALNHQNSRLGALYFHPSAEGVLATTPEGSVTVWDVEKEEKVSSWELTEGTSSASWHLQGKTLAVSKKNHTIDIVDVREKNVVAAFGEAKDSVKIQRLTTTGDKPLLYSTGSGSQASERVVFLWDERKLEGGPIASSVFDSSPGVLIPFYDVGTGVLFLAGKGDTKIGFYEGEYSLQTMETFGDNFIEDGVVQTSKSAASSQTMIHFLGQQSVPSPQIGATMLPPQLLDVKECEVARFLRLTKNSVEPVSFYVPRAKREFFQDDIYPDIPMDKPSFSVDEWKSGEEKALVLQSRRPEGMTPLSQAPKEENRGRSRTELFKEEQKRQATQAEVMDMWGAKIDEIKEAASESEDDDDEWDD